MPLAPKMEPEWSDKPDPSEEHYLRVLLLGAPHIGKSCAAIGTSPGPVYVINSDRKDSTNPVNRIHPNAKFAKNLVHSRAAMEDAIALARSLVKEAKVKTVVWDTMSGFAAKLEEECADQTRNDKGEPDGRRYWPVYTKYLVNVVGRLHKLSAHVIVTSHWIDTGGSDEMAGGVAKTGPGIVPLLGRSARARIGGEFDDVLFMDKVKGGRAFVTGIDGVWGPGSKNIEGNKTLPPDFKEYMKEAGLVKGARK